MFDRYRDNCKRLGQNRRFLINFKIKFNLFPFGKYRKCPKWKRELLDRSMDRSTREILFFSIALFRIVITPVNQALEGYHPWDSRGQNTRGQIYRLYGRPVSCCPPSPSVLYLHDASFASLSFLPEYNCSCTYIHAHSGGRQDQQHRLFRPI